MGDKLTQVNMNSRLYSTNTLGPWYFKWVDK